jgi:Phosphodiester glycosidase
MESSVHAPRRPRPLNGPPSGAGFGADGAGPRASGVQRLRRIALVAAAVALLPGIVSYAGTMSKPSNTSFGIRSIEWLRSNGGAGLVSRIENIYYTLTAPSKGGPQLKTLPHVGVALNGTGQQTVEHPYAPPQVPSLARVPLPGEGVWHPTRQGAGPYPPLLVSTFRSDPSEYPRLVAGVAWIDPHRTRIVLYPGTGEPSVSIPQRGPSDVPSSLRAKLLATFNAGFKYGDSHGGFALGGHTYAPMRDGQGTLIGYTGGGAEVSEWHGGPTVAANVAFATQNLPLIVQEGRPSPKLNDSSEWGATVGNAVQVWRSGIGIDRHGDLIYAQANDQTVESLARILIHAGAVRAIELDINSYWVSFNTYNEPGALAPTKLLAETERSSERYLTPDERDFFAVYER